MAVEIDHVTRTSWRLPSRSIVQSPALSSMRAQNTAVEIVICASFGCLTNRPSPYGLATNCGRLATEPSRSHLRRWGGVAIAQIRMIVRAEFAERGTNRCFRKHADCLLLGCSQLPWLQVL